MSRFHEEFFRPRGTKHDELMLKCIEKIDDMAFYHHLPKEILVLACASHGMTSIGMCFPELERYGCESCSAYKQCKISGSYPSKKTLLLNAEYVSLDGDNSYETEVICKNGSFIIGYADMVIKTRRGSKISTAHLSYNDKSCSVYPYLELNEEIYTIVEIKPELTDVGSTIRQLKTYQDILSKTALRNATAIGMVIATSSAVSESIEKYLLHESIYLYRVEGQ